MSTQPIVIANDLAQHYKVSRGVFAEAATLKAVDGASFNSRPRADAGSRR